MTNEHPTPNTAQSSDDTPVAPTDPNEGPSSEAADNSGSKAASNTSPETSEVAASGKSDAATSLNTSSTVAPPAKIAPEKSRRKNRTPQQKALDDAVEAHKKANEKGLAAIAAAKANLLESERERKFAAGTKMMHKLLLKCNASVRDAVISMLAGIADHIGQGVLHAYLEALNLAPEEPESTKR